MKQFDFEKKKTESLKALEPGGYVAKIMNTEIISYSWGEILKLDFDIAEGEFKDYYLNQYNNNSNEDKHWQGNIRIIIPDESSQYYESQKKRFGNMIYCFEDSNTGYVWDWDEKKLKNKLIGLVFGNEEYSYNGYEGWKAKPKFFVSVDDIHNNNYKIPKDKPLNKPQTTDFIPVSTNDIDLPWED